VVSDNPEENEMWWAIIETEIDEAKQIACEIQ
jgi:hypothetical protein